MELTIEQRTVLAYCQAYDNYIGLDIDDALQDYSKLANNILKSLKNKTTINIEVVEKYNKILTMKKLTSTKQDKNLNVIFQRRLKALKYGKSYYYMHTKYSNNEDDQGFADMITDWYVKFYGHALKINQQEPEEKEEEKKE